MLTPLSPQQAHDMWDWIRAGCEVVKEKLGDAAAPWRTEDIFLEVMTNKACVYTIGQDDGFCILQRVVHPHAVVMFVWVLYAPAGTMLKHKKELIGALDELARSIGAKQIEMRSPREAEWIAQKLFVPVSTIFTREV